MVRVNKDIINDILDAGKTQISRSKDIENDILVCRMHCEQAWCAENQGSCFEEAALQVQFWRPSSSK